MSSVYTDRAFTDTEILDELQRIVGASNCFLEVAPRGCVVDRSYFGGNGFNVRGQLVAFLNSYRLEEAYVEDGKEKGYVYEVTLPHSTR